MIKLNSNVDFKTECSLFRSASCISKILALYQQRSLIKILIALYSLMQREYIDNGIYNEHVLRCFDQLEDDIINLSNKAKPGLWAWN